MPLLLSTALQIKLLLSFLSEELAIKQYSEVGQSKTVSASALQRVILSQKSRQILCHKDNVHV